jgi:hypothetical protein
MQQIDQCNVYIAKKGRNSRKHSVLWWSLKSENIFENFNKNNFINLYFVVVIEVKFWCLVIVKQMFRIIS